jgi:hypothetical protein
MFWENSQHEGNIMRKDTSMVEGKTVVNNTQIICVQRVTL